MKIRVTFEEMKSVFAGILSKTGFSRARADRCAEIFALNSLEGVYSHGVNRFPRFVSNIKDGYIFPQAVPSLVKSTCSVDQ